MCDTRETFWLRRTSALRASDTMLRVNGARAGAIIRATGQKSSISRCPTLIKGISCPDARRFLTGLSGFIPDP